MAKITKAQVFNQMLKTCKHKSIYMLSPRKGKTMIPKTIEDIPPLIKLTRSKLYKSSYGTLYNAQINLQKTKARPARVVKTDKPVVKAKTLVVNLSNTITATITDKGLITVDFK
jgi:hypothetical protein